MPPRAPRATTISLSAYKYLKPGHTRGAHYKADMRVPGCHLEPCQSSCVGECGQSGVSRKQIVGQPEQGAGKAVPVSWRTVAATFAGASNVERQAKLEGEEAYLGRFDVKGHHVAPESVWPCAAPRPKHTL